VNWFPLGEGSELPTLGFHLRMFLLTYPRAKKNGGSPIIVGLVVPVLGCNFYKCNYIVVPFLDEYIDPIGLTEAEVILVRFELCPYIASI
jgi:hypothetical protein